jgi:hypothetical protein
MRRFLVKLSAFYDKRGSVCLGFIAFAVMLAVLFGGRTIGLSNNGDFLRVMDASSLQFDTDDGAFAFDNTYRIRLTESSAAGNVLKILFSDEGYSNYPSLQIPIVRLSVVANLILNKVTGSDMTLYRLGVLGVMYTALYAAVISFLLGQFCLKSRGADILAKTLILIVLCDVGYLTYFNSFYGEALQLITLVFLAAMLVRIIRLQPRLSDAVLCAAGCVVLGWSKFFNIPAACACAVLLFGIILLKTRKKTHAAAGLAALCALAVIYFTIPPWMSLQTKFNAVFFGALKDTEPAACRQYLDELGLQPEFIRYRNTNIYVEGVNAELEQNGLDRDILAVSHVDIAAFYLRHPDRLFNAAAITISNAGSIRPFYLSNFNNDAPKLTFSHRFSFWSDLRSAAGFDTWPGFAGVIVVFGLTAFIQARRSGRKWYEMLFVFLLCAGILGYFFIVPFMSNGEGDLAKHLFAFTQITDLMVLYVVISALKEVSAKKTGIISAGCLAMVLCLALTPVTTKIAYMFQMNKSYDKPVPGAYVTFGAYSGKALVWQIADTDGTGVTLICTDAITDSPFSSDGSNAWETSSLREMLNTSFLMAFTGDERAKLLLQENTVLLTRELKETATAGSRDFYFSAVPSLSARGSGEAYQAVVQDSVTLPDIDLVAGMASKGSAHALEDVYWLETPYFNNGTMTRCVMPDGSILMREAAEPAGVRPVIRIAVTALTDVPGTGTYSEPFVLK